MPGGRTIWMPKKVGEKVTLAFNFASDLDPAETLSSAVVTASVYSGVDASPSSIRGGTPTVSGAQVLQAVTAGVVGVIYELLCKVTTSLGQTLEMSAYIVVDTNLP